MHKIPTIILSIFFVLNLFTQNDFEGVIHYNLSFEDKTGEMTTEQSLKFMGTKQTYYIKGNKYKSVMNGLLNLTQYYTGKDTLYNQMNGFDGLLYVDAKKSNENVLSYKITNNQDVIGKYECKVLEIMTDKGITKYYYNDKVRVDPSLFINHNYGLWYFCLEQTNGALPLKMVSDSKEGILIITLDELISKELSDDIFEIPKDIPIVKSPD
jgi:hypothetical protein